MLFQLFGLVLFLAHVYGSFAAAGACSLYIPITDIDYFLLFPGMMRRRLLFYNLALITLCTRFGLCQGFGPAFIKTPPTLVLYSNNSGLILDCIARGDPPPIIDWVDQNGNVLSIHPNLAR